MEFIEGQRFYVTEARAEDLGRWLRGERVASRVVKPTRLRGARDEMARATTMPQGRLTTS